MNQKFSKIILILFILSALIIISGIFILSPIIMEEAEVWKELAIELSYFQRLTLSINYFFMAYGVLLVWLWIYAYLASCLQIIATGTNTENKWFAWIPIANIYLMCKIAGRPSWWLLLFFIPVVNIVISIIVWMGIAKACNKPNWLGILIIVPIANVIVPGYLAFRSKFYLEDE